MFDFKRYEGGETHRMLACVNVARFTIKGNQGDETTAGVLLLTSNQLSAQEKLPVGDIEDKKMIFDFK